MAEHHKSASSHEDSSQQPLLVNDEHQGWEAIQDLEEGSHLSEDCGVAQLYQEHPHDVLRYLQTKGVARLGEFKAPASPAWMPQCDTAQHADHALRRAGAA
jgi:hypothetical protein